jgi:hypothetical protein
MSDVERTLFTTEPEPVKIFENAANFTELFDDTIDQSPSHPRLRVSWGVPVNSTETWRTVSRSVDRLLRLGGPVRNSH